MPTLTSGAAPASEWTHQFGTSSTDLASDTVVDGTGNVYVVGGASGSLSSQNHQGEGSAYLRKYDSQGKELWTRRFGPSDWGYASSVAVDGTTDVYLAGHTVGADGFVSRYDRDGNQFWVRQLGFSDEVRTGDIAVDSNHNVYVVGTLRRGNRGPDDSKAFVRKYDSVGKELWTRQIDSSGSEQASAVAVDAAGDIYVAGSAAQADQRDAYVRKYDSQGNELWTRQFGASGFDDAADVAVDGAGHLYLVGRTEGSLPGQASLGSDDAFVRKYDRKGNELWTRQFGNSADNDATALAVTTGGDVYLVGNNSGPTGQTHQTDIYVRKYDSAGNDLRNHELGTSEIDLAGGVAVDTLGNVYVAGLTDGALPGQRNQGFNDAFVVKFSMPQRTIAWARRFGAPADDFISGVAADNAGNVYLVGDTDGVLPGQTSQGEKDAYVRKYDSVGNELWTRQFGSSGTDRAGGVAAGTTGNIYVAWEAHYPEPADSLFVSKYDNEGNELWNRKFYGVEGRYARIGNVAVDGAANVYVTGLSGSPIGRGTRVFVGKLDREGNQLWSRDIVTGLGASIPAVSGYSSGVYVAGLSELHAGIYLHKYDADGNAVWTRNWLRDDPIVVADGTDNVYLVVSASMRKYDSAGNEVWTRQFGPPGDATGAAVDNAGNVYAAGVTDDALPGQTSQGGEDAFVRQYDSDGNELWTRQFGSSGTDRVGGVAAGTGGSLYIVGSTDGAFPGQARQGGQDACVVKFTMAD